MARSALVLAAALFGGHHCAASYVPLSGSGRALSRHTEGAVRRALRARRERREQQRRRQRQQHRWQRSWASAEEQVELAGVGALSFGVGAVLGWLSTRRRKVASAAAAAAVAIAPAAPAIGDYNAVKYLGGADKVDLNSASEQAHRQFPGKYSAAAEAIAAHGLLR
mmetsp:Transcript_102097/g.284259  ORF Transcript_102097/g.284259 Transcript_102097/m.284259 type:complete len:166 (+) Transcript_102097:119-616(+)